MKTLRLLTDRSPPACHQAYKLNVIFKKYYYEKNILFLLLLYLMTGSFYFLACKKDDSKVNITLHDKPLSTIQSYIQGKWKLHYGKGGIAANNIQYYNNLFWTITTTNKIQISNNGNLTTDTTINWVKDVGTYTNGDSTFIMNFFDKLGYPANYVVDKIINDTLILHENAADAVFLPFYKIKLTNYKTIQL